MCVNTVCMFVSLFVCNSCVVHTFSLGWNKEVLDLKYSWVQNIQDCQTFHRLFCFLLTNTGENRQNTFSREKLKNCDGWSLKKKKEVKIIWEHLKKSFALKILRIFPLTPSMP